MKNLLFAYCFLFCILLYGSQDVSISNREISLRYQKGRIYVSGANGLPVLYFSNLNFAWSPQKAIPVRAEKVKEKKLRVFYDVRNDSSGKVRVSTTFELNGNRLNGIYEIHAPEEVKTGGIMLDIVPVNGSVKKKLYKSGIWTRAKNNGVPYELKDVYIKECKGKSVSFWMPIRGNHTWCSGGSEHLPLTKTSENQYSGEVSLIALSTSLHGFEAAAYCGHRPVGLAFSSKRDFNLWEKGCPEIDFFLSNTSESILPSAVLHITARDFGGKIVYEKQEKLSLEKNEKKHYSCKLPADERNIYFLEASVIVDGKEFFTRTNAALLPPYEFKSREKSTIGISSFFNEPSRHAVFQLMRRLGIRHIRSGDSNEAEKYGMIAFMHNNVPGKICSPEKNAVALKKMFDRYRKNRNIGWEFCNEWNFGQNTKEKRTESVRIYLSWVRAIDSMKKARQEKINLISLGFAGADPKYMQEIADQGGWALLDGIALHPGRGNMTPDCPGGGWFYYGSIRNTREKMKQLGIEKPLYLTEVYACTQPNNWWVDSYRLAAENVLLTFAIGIAENAASIQFYQMHNGTWFDINGINPKDREYDFGLLMRDNSPKPSILGFATAAEVLDGAEFLRYISIPKTKIRGMEFRTPKGKMAILYDRSEGYFFSKKKTDFVHKEAWLEHWNVKHRHSFRSSCKEILIRDAIGREKRQPVKNGVVALELDGAPRIVYGLDL